MKKIISIFLILFSAFLIAQPPHQQSPPEKRMERMNKLTAEQQEELKKKRKAAFNAPKLIAKTVRIAIRPTFFSTISCLFCEFLLLIISLRYANCACASNFSDSFSAEIVRRTL